MQSWMIATLSITVINDSLLLLKYILLNYRHTITETLIQA